MAKYLVIVESPSKATTIKKFLGSTYEVVASNGHVRDLPKSQLGIDIENDFEPKYITIRGKGELLAKLRREVKKADKIYLATDPDREGEAISWHLMHALKLESKNTSRITFNEITKNAVKQSIRQAREIDMGLVDAQQARRVLDRLVGYQISPVLWAKVKRGLSAGRVQSVALRIVADREEQINAFISKEYWTLTGEFSVEGDKKPFTADFYGTKDKKMTIGSEEEMDAIIKEMKKAKFSVSDVKETERTKKSPLPFTTSTLQQEAAKSLNFSTQKTMRLAQGLYEGVAVKGRGTVGLITYLRTDSTRISEDAKKMAYDYIEENYGADYQGTAQKKETSGKKIQDAHEAIRPTYVDLTPAAVKDSLSRDHFRLYQLIWKRFLASRMAPAKLATTTVKIDSDKYRFTSAASKVVFNGYLAIYQTDEDKIDKKKISKKITVGTQMNAEQFDKKQHFTQPPAHFTEASLVKTLEELGIGRPSTYAPTISTIINRHYVAKEQKNLYITELGEVVNSIMKKSFASIVDVNFTANNYEDKTVLGSSLPDFSGGFSTRLTYKGFTFSMSGTFSYGNMKSWDAEGRQFQFNAARPKNLLDIALKRWTPENPTNDYPKIRLNGTNYGMTDFWLHDASYLKINNISLTYQLPANWLRRTGFVDRAELFGSITNVYTFTSYPGPNPESFNRADKIAGAAVDYTAYPQTRTYNIGIKLSVK